uniref:Uncharacterized protein n=1 Tax=Populus trichocarpa TaxID=3694 RepID=A0A2K1XUR7_POPTR
MRRINKTPVLVHRILYLSNLPLVIPKSIIISENISPLLICLNNFKEIEDLARVLLYHFSFTYHNSIT